MGSPVCFPIECVVFLAIAVAAHALHHFESIPGLSEGRILGLATKFWKRVCEGETFLVYGDDIISPTTSYDALHKLLQFFHFLPNASKSFSTPYVGRESCGIYAIYGQKVTPHRPKLIGYSEELPESISGLIGAANQCLSLGYLNLRQVYLSEVLFRKLPGFNYQKYRRELQIFADWTSGERDVKVRKNPFPFCMVADPGDYEKSDRIYVHHKTSNDHLISRWDTPDSVVRIGKFPIYKTSKGATYVDATFNEHHLIAVVDQPSTPVKGIDGYLWLEYWRTRPESPRTIRSYLYVRPDGSIASRSEPVTGWSHNVVTKAQEVVQQENNEVTKFVSSSWDMSWLAISL